MSEFKSDEAALDRAYSDGKLVAYFGLATSAGCPFVGDQTDLRIAWLDGFAHGSWEALNRDAEANDRADDRVAAESGELPDEIVPIEDDDPLVTDIGRARQDRFAAANGGASLRGLELSASLAGRPPWPRRRATGCPWCSRGCILCDGRLLRP